MACRRRNCRWTAVVLSKAIVIVTFQASYEPSADCLYFPQQSYWLYPSWRQLQQMLVTLHCGYQAARISAYMLGERLQQESHLWLQEQKNRSCWNGCSDHTARMTPAAYSTRGISVRKLTVDNVAEWVLVEAFLESILCRLAVDPKLLLVVPQRTRTPSKNPVQFASASVCQLHHKSDQLNKVMWAQENLYLMESAPTYSRERAVLWVFRLRSHPNECKDGYRLRNQSSRLVLTTLRRLIRRLNIYRTNIYKNIYKTSKSYWLFVALRTVDEAYFSALLLAAADGAKCCFRR